LAIEQIHQQLIPVGVGALKAFTRNFLANWVYAVQPSALLFSVSIIELDVE